MKNVPTVTRNTAPVRWLVLTAIAGLVMVGCSSDIDPVETTESSPAEQPTLSGELLVHAAASLSDAFPVAGELFEAEHPGLDVVFNFAGSQTLAQQISSGAPGGVFASANETQMERVTDLLAGEPTTFATNNLLIVTPAGNPAGIDSLDDLSSEDVTLVLAQEDVPVGGYSRDVLAAAGVEVTPASLELDVRSVLTKVATGNADAGIVYSTDAATTDDVETIAIPADVNVEATYPIGAIAGDQAAAGAAFVAFVLSDAGQQVLSDHGFGPA